MQYKSINSKFSFTFSSFWDILFRSGIGLNADIHNHKGDIMERMFESGNVKGFLINDVLHLCRYSATTSSISVNKEGHRYYCRCGDCRRASEQEIHPDIIRVVRMAKEQGAKQVAYRHVQKSGWWSLKGVTIEGLPCVEACFFNGRLSDNIYVQAAARFNDEMYDREGRDHYAKIVIGEFVRSWGHSLGFDFKVEIGGSIVSQTVVWEGLEAIDADVRFLHATPENPEVRARVEQVTGLTYRKTIPLNNEWPYDE